MTVERLPQLLVFGYGSLIWNPGFKYRVSHRAVLEGYARRMYQGNTFHRGDDQLPGRVATIVADSDASCSGVVFQVDGEKAVREALDHLQEREVDNGYELRWVGVRMCDGEGFSEQRLALTCVAPEENEFYLGPDDVQRMADEISRARGRAGPNYEYVLKLASHIRDLFPSETDEHLFDLEHHVRAILVR